MAGRGQRDRGKEGLWRRVLRQWRRSGQAVRDYCVEHGLSEPSFYAWRRQLARRDEEAAAKPRFVPVHVQADVDVVATATDIAAAPPTIDVVLANGRRLRVPPGFDPATLRQLLAVLDEEPSC